MLRIDLISSKCDCFPVKFHIAHLYETQGRVKAAKERYEVLIREKYLENNLKADVYRQLGM